ncbi:precore/core protein [Sesbania bispinosa]|nr:precore/core protein [Sesbania bispinosa]
MRRLIMTVEDQTPSHHSRWRRQNVAEHHVAFDKTRRKPSKSRPINAQVMMAING